MATGLGLVWRELRHRHPLRGWLSFSDYRKAIGSNLNNPGTADFLGCPIHYSNGSALVYSIRELFQEEVYRFETNNSQPFIIDAGANIGISVLYFKRMFPNSRVLAYEPDPSLFALLQRNVSHLLDIELREAAAWTKTGDTLTFFKEGSLAGSTEIDYAHKSQTVSVVTDRLRDQLRGKRVDFLKIDIEGAENSVMFDIADDLGNVENLFFEYHSIAGKPQQLPELLSLVQEAGFRFYINGPHGPRLPFVDTVESGFDLQLNVACVRR